MESSRGRRVEKRGYEQGVDDEADNLPESKKAKLPALARFVFALIHEVYCLRFLLQSSSWSKQFVLWFYFLA
jgi:hypothetical protein